jgi:PAS domain S-box-containing protein
MKDENKTKEKLINELVELRHRVAQLERLETEHKQTEEALRESEKRYRDLYESAPNAYFSVSAVDGSILRCNTAAFLLLGYNKQEMLCMKVLDLYADTHDGKFKAEKVFNLFKAGESIRDVILQMRHKNGDPVWISLSVEPVRDSEGNVVESRSMAIDITERKRAEEARRKRTHDLGERIKELKCLFGISKLIERRDLSWGELFQGIVNLIPPAWQYPEITCARAILEGEEFRTENFRETNWRQTCIIAVHGEHIGAVEVFYLEERPETDEGPFLQEERSLLNAIAERLGRVLERKRAEEDVQEAYDHLEMQVKLRTAELARANEELRNEIAERKRMEEALRNSSEKLKSFAYSVIHDLKSPSIGIHGLAEGLYKYYGDILDERGKRYCDQILKASVHVAALTEKINVYIEAKESPLRIEQINVKEILQTIRDEFSSRLSIRQIEWMEPETIVNIKADRMSTIRVFRNFVDNALKYGGDALSEIRIGYEASDEFHTFSVSDNGVGIGGDDYKKIFELFRRDQTSKAIEGAGLGLAIIREIAERHGGKVWAEPGQHKGMTFHITISKDL